MKKTLRSLSRRHIIQIAIGAGAAAAVGTVVTFLRAQPPKSPDIAVLRQQMKPIQEAMHRRACQLVDSNQLVRPDGYIYTIDWAQFMIYFAQVGDKQRYNAMRVIAEKNLILGENEGNFTKGFVVWKWKQSDPRDASGTTEALRLARALWLGAKAFNQPADAELARKVLAGYATHEYTDQGVWFIRNYYKLGRSTFATNSFLVDYDPDFIREVAEERNDAELKALADKCYGAVKMAVAPSGLLYDIIQPEVATLYPELSLAAFSPNDVVQFSNCCTTALTIARGIPDTARKVLAFGMNRLDDLRVYYKGCTGEPYDTKPAFTPEYAMLAHLAARLGAEDAVATIADRAMHNWRWSGDHVDTVQVFTLAELLLSMHEIGVMKAW